MNNDDVYEILSSILAVEEDGVRNEVVEDEQFGRLISNLTEVSPELPHSLCSLQS